MVSRPLSTYTRRSISYAIFSTATNFLSSESMSQNQLRAVSNALSHFKPMPQLATPPPDSPAKNTNGDASKYTPELSPFARMLLKQTDISFTSRSLYHLCQTFANTDSIKHQHTHPTSKGACFCKANGPFATGPCSGSIAGDGNGKRQRLRTKYEPTVSTQYSFICF